jgi:dimethylamine/trimethylamine dehydrogenase
LPNDELFYQLTATPTSLGSSGIKSVRRIGDCYGPATIAAAVYEGRRYAEDFDRDPHTDAVPFKTVQHVLELGG